jgi:hypothetical protein
MSISGSEISQTLSQPNDDDSKLRSSTFFVRHTHLNILVSFRDPWRIRTKSANIDLVRKHINNDFVDEEQLKISRECTRPIDSIDNNEIYMSCVSYNSGNCWWNGPLSQNNISKIKLNDRQHIENIKNALNIVKPIPFRELNLFHGFEFHLKYDEHTWNIGNVYKFPFFLSKTPSWKVASIFSSCSGNITNTFFHNYLLCKYPRPGSKHICLNTRKRFNDEYEYLSMNESFRFVEKIYHFGLSIHWFWIFPIPIPVFRKYFVMEYDYSGSN